MQNQEPDFRLKHPMILQAKENFDHFMKLLLERCEDIPNAQAPICTGKEWDADQLLQYEALYQKLAACFNITTYPNQLEIVTADQMMDAYASIAMPVMFDHPSRGKAFLQTKQAYERGEQGLAYELVINTNPCRSYNMLENSAAMQSLVIAHAAIGHNSFFKNNKMFKQWTDASGIMDYLRYARDYIQRCEEVIGIEPVEQFITSCKAIENYGVDRVKRNSEGSLSSDTDRLKEMQKTFDALYDPLMAKAVNGLDNEKAMLERMRKRIGQSIDLSDGGHENILYCLEKMSPAALSSQHVNGSPWMVEVIRIMRKIAQYFYPQKQTQLMNEGWATFWHYALNHIAHHKGYVTDAQMAEILESHTGVVRQMPYNSKYYSGFNVYRLGWEMYLDIMFMADGPKSNDERRYYDENKYAETFAHSKVYQNGKATPLLGSDWLDALHYAMENHRDDEFVNQYLSLGVSKNFKMFSINDSDNNEHLLVNGTQANLDQIRESLGKQYCISNREADINVVEFDVYGDQIFRMKHTAEDGVQLNEQHVVEVMKHINVLLRGPRALGTDNFTGFRAELETVDVRDPENPKVITYGKRRG
tara:strand:- start:42816 stop:44579 length:1764 start_codon:yes stop_codon:yes gene_type:complete